jgi:hypothetical protein
MNGIDIQEAREWESYTEQSNLAFPNLPCLCYFFFLLVDQR